MKFPNLVYRCPGTHQCPGGTFDYHPVNSEAELTQLVKDGWFPTLPFAQDPEGFDLEKFLKEHIEPEVVLEPVNSPDPDPNYKDLTRAELEAKAKELGIGFSKNIKDETLAERIIQALENED